MKISDVKQQFKNLISQLDTFDDNDECMLELDDNCGGSYIDDLNSFAIQKGIDNIVYINNL